MSGTQQIATAGVAVIADDGNRGFTAAAEADDLALAALISPNDIGSTSGPSINAVVMPSARQSGGAQIIPERLIVAATGGQAGKLEVLPAWFAAFLTAAGAIDTTDQQGEIALSVRTLDTLRSALCPTNTLGAPTTYLLYATLQRTTSVSGVRKQKNLTTQVVSTVTVPLATEPTVTLSILPNATIASLPADTAESWNVPLAEIDIPDPYTSGTAITQSWIRQCWRRAGVGEHAVRAVRTTVPSGADISPIAFAYPSSYNAAYLSHRHVTKHVRRYLVNLSGASSFGILDKTLDFRRRFVRVTSFRGPNEGGGTPYPSVNAATSPGMELDESTRALTGDGPAFAAHDGGKLVYYVGTGVGTVPIAGALYLQTVAPTAGCYLIEIEFSDRLDE